MSFDPASDDVRIHDAREVTRSQGTRRIHSDEYYSHARIPCDPWSSVTPQTAPSAFAAADETWQHHRHVAVVALPEELIDTIRRLGIHDLDPVMAHRQLTSGVMDSVIESATEAFLCPGTAVKKLGWRAIVATTPTLTIDNKVKLRTGLHVDSWDSAPLRDRGQSRNRLCINLGRFPRYFLFVNLTMHGIWERLARPPVDPGSLGRPFLERYPDYPVTRLLVEPGYAYIAPTENLLHDGAAAAQGLMDITYTLLGRFQSNRCSK